MMPSIGAPHERKATLYLPCQALKIGKGLVRIDDQNFHLFDENIPLNITDTKLSIGFTLSDETASEDTFLTPQQAVITLSTDNVDSEMYLYPNLIDGKVYEVNVPLAKVSKLLLSQEKIHITVISGDPIDASLNAILKAGTLNPSFKLRAEKSIDFPLRFGVKDEIHHIFRQDPKNLPGFISSNFVFLLLLSLLVLFLAWNYFDAANINNSGKFNPVVYIFLGSVLAFEYFFFDYYCGTSIFKSLKRFTITGIFTLYFGSKALQDMYKLRLQNLR
ncbi:hypothetical protein PMKS-001827 [Pichia membranifaciens]|uniref:Ribophorin II C-terminal domain-containing protein n=1 Tax=Pichia membranifaciens TaxID=4926 RepID=A0A1Q2YFK8_9ASCO|nr:hypothetical protein PMKS-001827 [Pichia membranifaciens]